MARQFSLVLVSHHLPSRAIGGPLILFCGCLFLFAIILLIWSIGTTYFAATFDTGKLTRLEQQHARLTSELNELERISKRYNTQMERIMRHDDDMRVAVGIPDLPDDVRLVGIGGPVDPMDQKVTDGPSGKTYKQLKANLQRLIRQTELESVSFQAIHSKADINKTYWRRMPTIKPMEGYLSSEFGMRDDPFTGRRRLHKGVDFGARPGTVVRAPAEGIVIVTGWDRSYGRYVDIDHRNGYKTRYGHLSEILTRRGAEVKRGTQIGIVGKTGRATGEHLHYEVRLHGRLMNPTAYFYPEDMIVD